MTMFRILTDEQWQQVQSEYEYTDKPVEQIALDWGVSVGTIRNRRLAWNWRPRRPPVPREGPPRLPAPQIEAAAPSLVAPAAPAFEIAATLLPPPATPIVPDSGDAALPAPPQDGAAAPEPSDDRPMAARLQAALARVVPAIEVTVARLGAEPMHPRETERAARALAALTRALRELKELMGHYPAPAHADREPEDDAEFINDLVRRMDAFAAAHAAADAGPAPP
jgi:hypothetical protein